jgi:hypothetical protein
MKEIFVLVIIYVIHLIASILFYRKMVAMKSASKYLALVGYLILTYVYFELINVGHRRLRDAGYFFDFGHASIMLLITFVLSCVTAIVFIILIIVKFYRTSTGKYKSEV